MNKAKFTAVKGEDGLLYAPDGRRVYEFKCPNCNREMVAAKSMAMEGGLNAGHGSCFDCGQFFHLEMHGFNELLGDQMRAVKWEDYLEREMVPPEDC